MIVPRGVFLTGEQCDRIAGALVDADARARRNGRVVDDETRQVYGEIVGLANAWRASRTRRRVDGAGGGNAPSELGSLPGLLIGSPEAADLLGVSLRQVQRLAADGKIGARLVAGRWMFGREGVEDLVRGREGQKAGPDREGQAPPAIAVGGPVRPERADAAGRR